MKARHYNRPKANTAIPYKDRLLMAKYNQIADHRNDAAKTALMLACVALNNTEGLGFDRLCRFAVEMQKLADEYYNAEPEQAHSQLTRRLEQMGFRITEDGRVIGQVPAELLPEEEQK